MTRDQLETWIAATRRTQQRLVTAVTALAVVVLGLAIAGVPYAKITLGFLAVVGVCGFWVTAAHLADWRRRLEDARVTER